MFETRSASSVRGTGIAIVLPILLVASSSTSATLTTYATLADGGQEVPPNASSGSGSGTFEIDVDANTLTYDISFAGLDGNETVAHIHGPAPSGANGPAVHPLPLGSPKVGVWNYPESMEGDILEGRTYVNIHSDVFPGGEIRGQINPKLDLFMNEARFGIKSGKDGMIANLWLGIHQGWNVTGADFVIVVEDAGGNELLRVEKGTTNWNETTNCTWNGSDCALNGECPDRSGDGYAVVGCTERSLSSANQRLCACEYVGENFTFMEKRCQETLTVRVDPENLVDEEDETNNEVSVYVECIPVPVDETSWGKVKARYREE